MSALQAIAGVVLAAFLTACVPEQPVTQAVADKGLVGGIFDGRSGARIDQAELAARIADARFILLGERHDNPEHHRKQAELLALAASGGKRPAVVWEMIPAAQRGALKAYLESGRATAAGLGPVLNWEQSGWPDWAIYQPIADVALARGLAQYPGNIDRQDVMIVARNGFDGLPDATARVLAVNARWTDPDAEALKADLIASHCGHMPDRMIGPMGHVQRGRDAVMAAALLEADLGDGAVLIAGNGHVRADRGVPRYLEPETRVLAIGLIEAVPGETDPLAYLDEPGQFDVLIFTDAMTRPDRCAQLRKRFGGDGAEG